MIIKKLFLHQPFFFISQMLIVIKLIIAKNKMPEKSKFLLTTFRLARNSGLTVLTSPEAKTRANSKIKPIIPIGINFFLKEIFVLIKKSKPKPAKTARENWKIYKILVGESVEKNGKEYKNPVKGEAIVKTKQITAAEKKNQIQKFFFLKMANKEKTKGKRPI